MRAKVKIMILPNGYGEDNKVMQNLPLEQTTLQPPAQIHQVYPEPLV